MVLLKAWIGLFGSGEISTRLLSLIPAWLSLIAMAVATRGGGFTRQLIAILFLGTSPLFSLYAQEVRPYAWALLFATTAVTTMTLLWRSQRPGLAIRPSKLHRLRLGFGLSLLLLSLSHYFGLFYAATLVALDLRSGAPCLGRRRHGLILLVSLTAWPLLHRLFGGGGGRTAWIEPQPVVGVIKAAFNGVFPAFSVALALALMTTLAWALGERKRQQSRPSRLHQELRCDPNSKEALKLLAGAATFLGLICLIDLIKPLSVERYFIVLLPALALALADGGQALFNSGSTQTRRATAIVLAVTIAMHFGHSQEVLSAKIYPQQNYKQLASFLRATDLCSQGCSSNSAKKERLRPYFDTIPVVRIERDQADRWATVRLPFIGLHGEQELIRPLLASHPEASCWEPRQFSRSSTFVILNVDSEQQPQSFGLQRCAK
ncbi:hypothetical protein KQ302_02705 [Synechococcus sp. CS-602]|uniref:hypothetical protein n=1 Tax=Synechococcaceae TaxID=1890426 RepID=UPI001645863E|nr:MULTISPECIES: hypothetical protein [Synechococcaceae]MCT0204028.1 hypothetical protein [Synechococcus sp. CS-602]MCT4366977.1 hypothetical protein [Candidatus Regnicoccus frigidus MAG-AL2]